MKAHHDGGDNVGIFGCSDDEKDDSIPPPIVKASKAATPIQTLQQLLAQNHIDASAFKLAGIESKI